MRKETLAKAEGSGRRAGSVTVLPVPEVFVLAVIELEFVVPFGPSS